MMFVAGGGVASSVDSVLFMFQTNAKLSTNTKIMALVEYVTLDLMLPDGVICTPQHLAPRSRQRVYSKYTVPIPQLLRQTNSKSTMFSALVTPA